MSGGWKENEEKDMMEYGIITDDDGIAIQDNNGHDIIINSGWGKGTAIWNEDIN